MKLFRKIYYIALAAVFILMFSLTVADVTGGKGRGDFNTDEAVGYLMELAGSQTAHSLYNSSDRAAVVTKLTDKLQSFGFKAADGAGTDGKRPYSSASDTTIKFAASAGVKVPTFFVQGMSYSLDQYYKDLGTGHSTDTDEDDEKISVDTTVFPLTLNNVYAAFPGKAASPKTVVIMAHYDSVPMGPGASDDMSSVSAMLAVINSMMTQKASYENNILFVFTDGEEFGLYGAKMAKGFTGIDGAMQNVGFVANFESRGTAGTSIMFETNANNYEVIKQYAKISNSIYSNSIANFVYSVMPNYTDFSVFKTEDTSVPGVNFANMGEGENYHSQNDNIANATDAGGRAFISQHGDIMGRIVKHFGDLDLSTLSKEGNAVFFNYLNLMVIYYPTIVAVIMGAVILGLLIGIIGFNIKKKAFCFKKMGLGVAAQLIALVGTVGLMFGAYYIFGLIAALFNKIDIHNIAAIKFSSPGLVIGMLALGAVFSAALHTLFKKIFNIKAGDIVNGSILVLCVAAAAVSFILPAASFLLAWLAVLEAVVWLVTVIIKDKFKERRGYSIERLFLPFIPVILCIPMTLSVIMLAGDALGAYLYPVISAVAVLSLGVITPYFSYLKPLMDKVYAKLPPMRFRTVAGGDGEAAQKHDAKDANRSAKYKAKGKNVKGKPHKADKSAESEVKYVYTEVPRKYTNRGGLGILTFVICVFLLFFSLIGGNQAIATAGSYGANSGMFADDALVFVIDKQANENYWMVSDLHAYQSMKYELDGYKYNKDLKSYKKPAEKNFFESYVPAFTKDNIIKNKYQVVPAAAALASNTIVTRYTLTIDNSGKALSSIDLTSGISNTMRLKVADTDKIVLRLTGAMTIVFNTPGDTVYRGAVTYTEEIAGLYNRAFEISVENTLDYGIENSKNEWKAVKDIGVNSKDSTKTLRFKLAVKYITTFTCG